MEFRLLGPLEVLSGGRSLAVGGGKRRSLLAILLLHSNEVVSAERLIDELWGERPPPTAAKSVHVYVSQLRKELGPDDARGNGSRLVTRSGGYELRVGPDDVDVARFERALAEAELSLGGDAARASSGLREALALWRGPALADFTYERFAQGEIARLEELRLVALEGRVEADLSLGRHAQVVGELEALVREHPLRERVQGQLMLALYRCGRQGAALEVYRDGRRRTVDELGLEPGPALRELQEKILDQSADLEAPATAQDMRGDGAQAATAAAPPVAGGWRRRWRPAALVVGGGAVLLGASALAALSADDGGSGGGGRATLELAPNSVAAVDARTGRPAFALPLPGRPTALRATGRTVWAATVDSASLTGADARTRSVLRQVPLRMRPDALAVGGRTGWVADGRRGELVRITLGYADTAPPIRFRREPPPRSGAATASVAVGAGGVWITDGSRRLVRVDPATRAVRGIPADRPLDGVAVGAGAVWAISARRATVLRIDPATDAVTDRVALVSRAGENAPSPTRIAASAGAVWVLSRNTATVTRIDPQTRGVAAVVPIGVDRSPNEIAASGQAAWVANEDGTLSRIDQTATSADSLWVGGAVREVAVAAGRVWVATSALDQQLQGGRG